MLYTTLVRKTTVVKMVGGIMPKGHTVEPPAGHFEKLCRFVIKDMEESGTVDDYQTEFEQKIGGHKYVVWLTVFHCPQADELAITDITTRSENEHAVPSDAYLRRV